MEMTYGPDARAISLSLPVRDEPYGDAETRAFFGGLLPEGSVRDHLARQLGVSPGNDFSLLPQSGAIAPEPCASSPRASTPRPMTSTRSAAERGRSRHPDQRASATPARDGRSGRRPPVARGCARQGPGPCLSRRADRAAAERDPGSTHIIKAPIPQISDSIVNEAFCLGLARELGIHAVAAEPRTAADIDYLLVTRYDRREIDGRTIRVHQEDMVQALGRPSETKYEAGADPASSTASSCFGARHGGPAVMCSGSSTP